MEFCGWPCFWGWLQCIAVSLSINGGAAFYHSLNTCVLVVLCWQAQLTFPDIRTLHQLQPPSLRFINPMDYCKSLYCCWKWFGLSFPVRCWSSPWWLLRGYCGAVFGWWSRSKLPRFLLLLGLPGDCTNSCVRMGSFVLGEEWWLTCVCNWSLTKDLFKGMSMVAAVWVCQAALFPDPSFLLPRVPVVNKGNWLLNCSLQPFCRNHCSALSVSWDLGLCLKGI